MKLRQWLCFGPQGEHHIYTPVNCDAETALVIGYAFFGKEAVTSVGDQGTFYQTPPKSVDLSKWRT